MIKITSANDYRKLVEGISRYTVGYSEYPTLVMPRVVMEDGFSISIQAGSGYYSTPREDGLLKYAAFELGYPSKREPLLDDYAETDWETGITEYTKTSYPYVPVDVVDSVITKHGGIIDIKIKPV